MLEDVTLVLGGASSGKTAWAEDLTRKFGLPMTYIATAQPLDDEMAARIAAHKAARGPGWKVVEAPLDVAGALRAMPAGRAVLLDCATMWLSNQMAAGGDVAAAQADLVAALAACPAPVVVVSNELGLSVVPDNALARRFRDAQGRLNQQIAARAGLVVAVMAGLPLALKGALPDDGGAA